MVNWGSVFAMVANLKILFTETKDMRHHYYDWLLGMPQYLIGFIITFTGLKALQGASRSLLSKVSPPNSKNLITSIGTIATFVGLFAQFLADVQILTVGLSHRVINTDIVNSLVMPLLFGCLVAYYFVRKHYFFLM
jgi:preprotein translocase subunit SecE